MTSLAPRFPTWAALGPMLLVLGCRTTGSGASAVEDGASAVESAAEAAHERDPAASADATEPDAATPVATEEVVALDHPGCFLLMDLADEATRIGEAQSCDERTTPASTFKIPHALIALDTGVVTDPDAIEKWDGTKYAYMPTWERDHSLRTAIEHSVVWFFQRTARAIGRERMREYLEAFNYGNADVSGPIDRFWLEGGGLEVSPRETLRFWADLFRDRLPRGSAQIPTLRPLLVRPVASWRGRMADGASLPEVDSAMVLSAKTGTDSHGDGSVTWWAGHVACPDRQYVFVSRVIADEPPSATSPAVTHGMAALDRLGVLRCDADEPPT